MTEEEIFTAGKDELIRYMAEQSPLVNTGLCVFISTEQLRLAAYVMHECRDTGLGVLSAFESFIGEGVSDGSNT